MKKYLNVLCVLMLVLMAVSIVMPLVMDGKEMAQAFNEGFNEGMQGTTQRVIESPNAAYATIFIILTGIPVFVLGVVSLVNFIKFILNVNNDKVFVWENVSLLRWAGRGLLSVYIWLFVNSLLMQESIGKFFYDYIDSFILSVFILIVAEVFAIGMKIKEEQDLTI